MADDKYSSLDAFMRSLGDVVKPLEEIASGVIPVVRDLGFDWPVTTSFPVDFSELVADQKAVVTDLVALEDAQGDAVYGALATLATDAALLIAKIIDLENKLSSGFTSAETFATQSGIAEELPRRLLDYLVANYLVEQQGLLAEVLTVLGILEWRHHEAEAAKFRLERVLPTVHWERLPKLLSNPRELLDLAYGWSTDFDADLLVDRLGGLARKAGLPLGMALQDDQIADALGRPAEGRHELRVALLQMGSPFGAVYSEIGLRLFSIAKNATSPAALALMPYGAGAASVQGTLGNWRLGLSASLDLSQGVAVIVQPPDKVDFKAGLQVPGASTSGSLKITLENGNPTGAKTLLFGSPGATRFEYGDIGAAVELLFQNLLYELCAETSIKGAALVVQGGDGDGFLQKILPSNPITIDFDLTVGISNKKGFYFKGGVGLEYTLQINESIGPITVTTIDLKLFIDDKAVVTLTAAVSANGELGPVAASVSKIGLKLTLEPGKKGNLGYADLSLGFKPPSGVGLAIDASVVKGGGFLEIEDGNYAGILNLDIQEKIAVTAIGILTTRLPDGSKIFSLKIIGMVEFPPIQLGFGFFLSGIGIAVAIECTMNADALRASVYTGSLTSLLFPPDPIKNAAKIIADIKSFFPPKNGCFVFGAMVKAGWGGATSLIKLAVGIFIEIEGTSLARIALAGDVLCELPTHDDAVVHIEMQFIGIIDFGNCTLSIDAAIVNSFITKFNLAGGMALRTCWGEKPRFAMAAGGFYPGYRAPDGFPALARISISLGDDNPRIGLFMYMAIAENSVQFGAALLFYFSKDITIVGFFEVEGALGFDAIIRFNPFSFEADLYARLTVKRNHQTFCGIDLELYLSGPNDYHAVGHAKVEVCGISAKVEFDKHFGDKTVELPAPVISPLQMLLQ